MKLEQFRNEDLETYVRLATDFHNGPASFTPPNVSVFVSNFKAILEAQGAFGWFIVDDEEIAGYVLCSQMYSTEIGALQLWIEEISVLETYQGKGIGSLVLDEIVMLFPNVKRFRLEVAPANESAKRLYKRKGYEFITYEQMIIDRK